MSAIDEPNNVKNACNYMYMVMLKVKHWFVSTKLSYNIKSIRKAKYRVDKNNYYVIYYV